MQSNTRPGQENVRYESGPNILPVEGNDTAQILIDDHMVIKQLLSELCNAQQAAQRKPVTVDRLRAGDAHSVGDPSSERNAASVSSKKRHPTIETKPCTASVTTFRHEGQCKIFGIRAIFLWRPRNGEPMTGEGLLCRPTLGRKQRGGVHAGYDR